MKKVLFYKLDQEHYNQITNSFRKNLSIFGIQPYNPCYTKFFTYYNNDSYQKYIPRSKEVVYSLEKSKDIDESDNYKKYVFQSKTVTKHKSGNIFHQRDIFVKPIPLLDPIEFSKNQYRKPNHFLPNIFSWMTQKKINDTNNAAYVENLASFLLSNITERDECPSFPLYYGGFVGSMNGYKYDATEEWEDLVEEKWFKQSCNQKKIKIEMKENKKFDELFNSYETYTTEENVEDEEYINTIQELDEDLENMLSSKNIVNLNNIKGEESDIEELSDFELNSDNLVSTKYDIEKYKWIKWLNFYDFPVLLCCMETLEQTLEEYLNIKEITETEWKGILFQICFALAIVYRKYNFIHNDFHCSNIMVVNTEKEFLYYCVKNTYFKIPTYGKIIKIIDFNRSIFKVGKQQFFSDVFKKDGDADGQYDYPYNNKETNGHYPPNPSFDLARLATTIYEYVPTDSKLFSLFSEWTTDNYGNCLLEEEDSFDLYIKLSHNIKNSKPEEQLYHSVFDELICSNKEIKNNKVYTLY